MSMTPEQWAGTCTYLNQVFGQTRASDGRIGRALKELPSLADAAGLPPIAISGDVGHLLTLLAQTVTHHPGAAKRAIEVGTLGGYSGLWIVRGMPVNGRLFTIEREPAHADFALRQFQEAGVTDRIELIRAGAGEALPALADRLGTGGADLVFLDADKREYVEYLRILKPVLRIGGLLVADNALGSNRWWITDDPADLPEEARASREGADRFNRIVAADEDFETACVPIREGVLIARRTA